MPPLSYAHIQKGEQNIYGQRYHIEAEEGYVQSDLTADNIYRIGFYRVMDKYQGQRYGKELLRLAKEHAVSIGARAVTSSVINSDESAGAMAAVFGYRHLTGGIDPRKVTSYVELFSDPTLEYPISENDPTLRSDVQILPGIRPLSGSPVHEYWNQRHN